MNSLYLNHFGLASAPFSITPDPGFFFEGKDRGLFISGLLHATLNAEGIVIVIGEVGSGKTLMSRILLTRLPDYVNTVYLPNPAFSRDEIIDVIARDLGLVEPTSPQGGRLEILQQELIKLHTQGKRIVVLIDEAHTMPPDSLEEVRRLSNLETDNHKLVQIILFGQPELNTLLEAPQLRQVNDRVVYRLTLRNLSHDDARAYLDHRLRVAGWRGGRMFTWLAERKLLGDASGRARRINLIADKSLLAAYADQSSLVQAKHVRLAIRDVGKNFTSRDGANKTNGLIFAMWLASIAATAALSIWFSNYRSTPNIGRTALSIVPVPVVATSQNSEQTPILNQTVNSVLPLAAAITSTTSESHQPISAATPIPTSSPHVAQATTISTATNTAPTAKNVTPTTVPSGKVHQPTSFAEHIRQDYTYAHQVTAANAYAIQLATIQTAEDAEAFLSVTEKTLNNDRVFVRRSPFGKQSDYQQSRYVIYLGGYASLAATNRSIAQLPDKYRLAKPIIRTWKEIIDAPWIH